MVTAILNMATQRSQATPRHMATQHSQAILNLQVATPTVLLEATPHSQGIHLSMAATPSSSLAMPLATRPNMAATRSNSLDTPLLEELTLLRLATLPRAAILPKVITRCCDSAELKLTLWRKCLFLLHSSCVQYTLEILIRGNNLSNTYLFFALLPVVCGRQ